MNKFVSCGDIYTCDFGQQQGCIQSGVRLCVIIDNSKACAYSNIIHCCPLTSQQKNNMPLHYVLSKCKYTMLDCDSVVLCEQYGIIDKSQLGIKVGAISPQDLYFIVERCKQNLPF